jgi:hypothetical protein
MRLNYLVTAYVILFLAATAAANSTIYLTVSGPVSATLNASSSALYLGRVGPGESFYVLASAATVNSVGAYVNVGWDKLTYMNLPQGWSAQPSPLYQNPMKMKITVAPNALNGVYNLTLRAVNLQNSSGLGNLTFKVRVNVTLDVFKLSIMPQVISVGVGQPADLYVTINNTGISDDPFIINAQGLPAWNVSDEVIAPHAASTSFTYPVFENTPGPYNFNLTVRSATSSLLIRQSPITMTVNSTLLNDYSAVGQGVIISPVIMEPAYSFMLLLSDIYNAIVH